LYSGRYIAAAEVDGYKGFLEYAVSRLRPQQKRKQSIGSINSNFFKTPYLLYAKATLIPVLFWSGTGEIFCCQSLFLYVSSTLADVGIQSKKQMPSYLMAFVL
jgi:hypothetical protein